MSIARKQNKTMLYYINSLIMVIIPFIFFQLPPVSPITAVGMKVIGCFIDMLYGWLTIGMLWPSIFGLLMMLFTGYPTGVGDIFKNGFGNDTVIMVTFMYVFTGLVNITGVSKYIAMWFVSRKSVEGKPWAFSFMFIFAVYILGALTSGTPSVLLGWSLLAGICEAVGYKAGEPLPKFLFFSVLIAGPLGMDVLPFKTISLTTLGMYSNMTGEIISSAQYISMVFIIDMLIILAYLALGKYIFKIDVSRLKDVTAEKIHAKDAMILNDQQKAVLIGTGLMFAALILPGFMPASWPITQFFNSLGTAGIVMAAIMLFVFVKIDGKPICDFKACANAGMAWDAWMLTVAGLYVSTALASDKVGFIDFFTDLLGPMLSNVSPVVFVMGFVLVATIFTNFCSNLGTATALVPIAIAMSMAMGINPAIVSVLIIKCCHFAYFTPAASPATALCMANKEWIDSKTHYKYSTVLIIIEFIITIVVGLSLGSIIL